MAASLTAGRASATALPPLTGTPDPGLPPLTFFSSFCFWASVGRRTSHARPTACARGGGPNSWWEARGAFQLQPAHVRSCVPACTAVQAARCALRCSSHAEGQQRTKPNQRPRQRAGRLTCMARMTHQQTSTCQVGQQQTMIDGAYPVLKETSSKRLTWKQPCRRQATPPSRQAMRSQRAAARSTQCRSAPKHSAPRSKQCSSAASRQQRHKQASSHLPPLQAVAGRGREGVVIVVPAGWSHRRQASVAASSRAKHRWRSAAGHGCNMQEAHTDKTIRTASWS